MVLGSVHIVAHVISNFFVEGCTVPGCPETEVQIISSSSTKHHVKETRGRGIKKNVSLLEPLETHGVVRGKGPSNVGPLVCWSAGLPVRWSPGPLVARRHRT